MHSLPLPAVIKSISTYMVRVITNLDSFTTAFTYGWLFLKGIIYFVYIHKYMDTSKCLYYKTNNSSTEIVELWKLYFLFRNKDKIKVLLPFRERNCF